MSKDFCPKCGSPLSQIGNVDICIDCDNARIELPLAAGDTKPCPVCGETPTVSGELTNGHQWAACENPRCMMFSIGFPLVDWNRPRPVEEVQAGVITILEFFRDDAKAAADEAITLLGEIMFMGPVPKRTGQIISDLRKLISREK